MTTNIGIRAVLKTTFDQAILLITDALKGEGFGVLTQIDVQLTLKDKINIDFHRYVILGACNPTLAYRALSSNPDVGLLLPCNVTVQEVGNEIIITAVDPVLMLGIMKDNPAMKLVAIEAKGKLETVINSLK